MSLIKNKNATTNASSFWASWCLVLIISCGLIACNNANQDTSTNKNKATTEAANTSARSKSETTNNTNKKVEKEVQGYEMIIRMKSIKEDINHIVSAYPEYALRPVRELSKPLNVWMVEATNKSIVKDKMLAKLREDKRIKQIQFNRRIMKRKE